MMREEPLLEEIFTSKGRVRILKILLKYGEVNITKIAREAGLNHTATEKHLRKLVELGLVSEERFGRLRIYRLNYSNPTVYIIREFIRALEME